MKMKTLLTPNKGMILIRVIYFFWMFGEGENIMIFIEFELTEHCSLISKELDRAIPNTASLGPGTDL